jgi:hypothetical protein
MRRFKLYILFLLPLLVGAAVLFGPRTTSHRVAGNTARAGHTMGSYRQHVRRLAHNIPPAGHSNKHKKGHKASTHRLVFSAALFDDGMLTNGRGNNSEAATAMLPQAYTYLYFQEINPPPPRA